MNAGDVLIKAAGSPFDGMTLGQAYVLNDALCGHRVEVIGGKYPETKHRPREYVFGHIVLPGSLSRSPFEAVGDLCLHEWNDERQRGEQWHTRCVSASLVRSFKVIEAPELGWCRECCEFVPYHELRPIEDFDGAWCPKCYAR